MSDGLSAYEVKWLTDAPAKKDLENTIKTQTERDDAREKMLDALINDHIADLTEDISKAQDVILKQQSGSNAVNAIWKTLLRRKDGKVTEIKWRASDDDITRLALNAQTQSDWRTRSDVEVDTKEDVHDLLEIPEDQLKLLNDSLASILATQERMKTSYDKNGNRLFSDKDIMDELWTPLVRAGTIPENMVPDLYSEQAHAWDGAAEIYGDKLKAFAAQSHGKEGLLRGLTIAKDTLTAAGAVVSNSITIANAQEVAEKKELLTKASSASEGEASYLSTADQDALRTRLAKLEQQKQYADLATAFVGGGLDIGADAVKEGAKDKEERDWVSFAGRTSVTMLKVAQAGVKPFTQQAIGSEAYANAVVMSKSDDPERKAAGEKFVATITKVNTIEAAVAAGITGVQMGPTLYRAYISRNETTAAKVLAELAGNIADAVQTSMNAVATSIGGNTGAEIKQAAAGIAASIKAAAKGPAVYDAIKEGRTTQAAAMLGSTLVGAGLAASSEAIFDAMRKDVEKGEFVEMSTFERLYAEKTGTSMEKAQTAASAKMIDAIGKQVGNIEKMIGDVEQLKAVEPDTPEAIARAERIRAEVEQKLQAKAKEDLEKAFGDPKAVRDMIAEFDAETKDIEEMYLAAYPDDALPTAPPDEAARAMEAIDRAIQKSQALRAKVEIVNAATGSAASVIAAFVPGGGAVVAAQKIVFDLYAICKATQLHNKWCESMEIAFRANSSYGAAIERTMMNARIELSQRCVELVLHSLQCSAAVAACFDPTGAAAATQAAANIAEALTTYGYKMQKQSAIEFGWNAYRDALDNPGNRKRARKALRLNSTLAKCCIAYGATVAQDPAAKEAIRISGLSVSVMVSDKDVCNSLVAYLRDQLNNDPDELKVVSEPAPWQPGRPKLTAVSWFETKAAATTIPVPRLDPASAKTPAIDGLLAKLAKLWEGEEAYAAMRAKITSPKAQDLDKLMARLDGFKKDSTEYKREAAKVAAARKEQYEADLEVYEARKVLATESAKLLTDLKAAFGAYAPQEAGSGSKAHSGMTDVVNAMVAAVKINLAQVTKDEAAAPPAEPEDSED